MDFYIGLVFKTEALHSCYFKCPICSVKLPIQGKQETSEQHVHIYKAEIC